MPREGRLPIPRSSVPLRSIYEVAVELGLNRGTPRSRVRRAEEENEILRRGTALIVKEMNC